MLCRGGAPPYLAFKAIVGTDRFLQSLTAEFANFLPVAQIADEDGHGQILETLSSMAYSWVSFQFEQCAADAESKMSVANTNSYFDPTSVTDLHMTIKLWPLVEACR